VALPADVFQRYPDNTSLLLKLCCALADEGGVFYLTQRDAAKVIGLGPKSHNGVATRRRPATGLRWGASALEKPIPLDRKCREPSP
jgi:hypothetical protein